MRWNRRFGNRRTSCRVREWSALFRPSGPIPGEYLQAWAVKEFRLSRLIRPRPDSAARALALWPRTLLRQPMRLEGAGLLAEGTAVQL